MPTGDNALPFDPTPIVYTLIPFSRAMSAAVSGATRPVLLEPSVSNMILLDFAFPSTIRFMAVANPSPMAVPSSNMPISRLLIELSNIVLSFVIGVCVKHSPAKTTNPILSVSLPCTNFAATSFAAPNRSGVKSWANMLVDISRAITISVPSTFDEIHLL